MQLRLVVDTYAAPHHDGRLRRGMPDAHLHLTVLGAGFISLNKTGFISLNKIYCLTLFAHWDFGLVPSHGGSRRSEAQNNEDFEHFTKWHSITPTNRAS
jgi:hypothetical protein